MFCKQKLFIVFLLKGILYHSYNEGITPKGRPVLSLPECAVFKFFNVQTPVETGRQPHSKLGMAHQFVVQETELSQYFWLIMFFTSDPIRVIIGLQVLRGLSVRAKCWAAV